MVAQDSIYVYHPEEWGVRCIRGKKQHALMHLESTSFTKQCTHSSPRISYWIGNYNAGSFKLPSQYCWGDGERLALLIASLPDFWGSPRMHWVTYKESHYLGKVWLLQFVLSTEAAKVSSTGSCLPVSKAATLSIYHPASLSTWWNMWTKRTGTTLYFHKSHRED